MGGTAAAADYTVETKPGSAAADGSEDTTRRNGAGKPGLGRHVGQEEISLDRWN